jgi:hypothetical protein
VTGIERPTAIRLAIPFGLVPYHFDEVKASVGGHDPLVDRSSSGVQDVSSALFYPRGARPARRELRGCNLVQIDERTAHRSDAGGATSNVGSFS